jgi:hypothetical protein
VARGDDADLAAAARIPPGEVCSTAPGGRFSASTRSNCSSTAIIASSSSRRRCTACRWRRFIPYTSRHLHDLGVQNISAVISLGQTTEILVMLLLAGVLARVRLKWVFLSGIAICVVRYSCNALEHAAMAPGRHGAARLRLHALFHHHADLSRRARRSEMARTGAGACWPC